MPETQQSSKSSVSLVIPAYNEEEGITATLNEIVRVLDAVALDKEIIVVDDGSSDNTWNLLQQISLDGIRINLIRLSRNFGKESAIMAGIDHCSGDAVIILDSDMQHPPELLVTMINTWQTEEIDIIDGVKEERSSESWLNRTTSSLYNSLFKLMTGYDLTGASDYKLLGRKAIDALHDMRDGQLFFRGTAMWLGFKRKQLNYQVEERLRGKSKLGFLARTRLAISALTSFTALPLHMVTMIGIASLLIAVVMGIQTLYMYFSGIAVEGFTTVIILILFFGSMIMLGLGIIGAYLSKILDEVRGRPRYLVQEIVESD